MKLFMGDSDAVPTLLTMISAPLMMSFDTCFYVLVETARMAELNLFDLDGVHGPYTTLLPFSSPVLQLIFTPSVREMFLSCYWKLLLLIKLID